MVTRVRLAEGREIPRQEASMKRQRGKWAKKITVVLRGSEAEVAGRVGSIYVIIEETGAGRQGYLEEDELEWINSTVRTYRNGGRSS